MRREGGLALTTWLIWGAAASLPFLIGRNPFPLAIAMTAVLTVRWAGGIQGTRGLGWSLVIRAGLFLAAISVLFNVLTVRAGDLVIVTLPDWTGWLAGELTWNAVIYGLLSAFAILGLIVTWATVSSAVDWAGLTRILPDRLLGFAVGGSIAINLVPQTVASVIEIREAAAARGFAVRGPHSFATIVSPVVSGSMERALRLSEVLEARGFGARPPGPPAGQRRHQIGWNGLLAGSAVAIYATVAGAASYGVIGSTLALAGLGLLLTGSGDAKVGRTRYRTETRDRADWLVSAGAIVALVACVVARNSNPSAFVYEPYPTIGMPAAHLWLLIAHFGLFVPAMIVPDRERSHD